MKNKLNEILNYKKEFVRKRKKIIPQSSLIKSLKKIKKPKSFLKKIQQKISRKKYFLIAEVKRSSPSGGLIRKNFNPKKTALAYEKGGATCLSVLTDKKYFGGCNEYLSTIRKITNLPILRKDFIFDPYQVIESRIIGADCILLIMAILGIKKAQELERVALDCGLDVLIEIHNKRDLEKALNLQSKLIGINNRNLKTLKTDLSVTKEIAPLVPKNRIIVSESGINNEEDIIKMLKCKINGFLVGETLMRSNNIEDKTKRLSNVKF